MVQFSINTLYAHEKSLVKGNIVDSDTNIIPAD